MQIDVNSRVANDATTGFPVGWQVVWIEQFAIFINESTEVDWQTGYSLLIGLSMHFNLFDARVKYVSEIISVILWIKCSFDVESWFGVIDELIT